MKNSKVLPPTTQKKKTSTVRRHQSAGAKKKADAKQEKSITNRSLEDNSKQGLSDRCNATTESSQKIITVIDTSRWEFDKKPTEVIAKNTSLFRATIKKGARAMREEFRTLRTFNPEGGKDACVVNEAKNRYKDILLLDNNRIKLKDLSSDYIHASKVMVGTNPFICAQAPLSTTALHFWVTVAQENVKLIVMLCQLTEDGKEKSFDYYPRVPGTKRKFGEVQVTCTAYKTNVLDGVSLTNLELQYKGRTDTIEHLQYEKWPDHAAPDSLDTSLKLLRMSRERRANAPVLVHCSAGVGRTGCFVGVELARHMAATEQFSMEKLLKQLRSQRMHSIQNDLQYLYVCRSLLECLVQRRAMKRVDMQKFASDYDQLIQRKKNKNGKKTVETADEGETK